MGDLVLDSKICNWVLLPIAVVMVLVELLRHYVMKATQTEKKLDLKTIRETNVLLRTRNLRANGAAIPPAGFKMRKAVYTNKENGILCTDAPKPVDPMAAFSNPEPMMEMMKKNILGNALPNIGLMAYINYFFSGFLVAKMPFPLTPRFRSMLQRGVELSELEPTYISSLSWYFLTMYGRKGIVTLLIGEESTTMDEARMMQAQMQAMSAGQMDIGKAFAAERENLEITDHYFGIPASEASLLERLESRKVENLNEKKS
mmetsp:Transcript_36198/g.58492  ORF Transcript_36198/g.58492 Transcript_36198/m.58492 type:complete len:259 (-) Transcript_36198:71-847(-)|eukprot:CAMPEP_0184333416 /NCGR_PEP_ID=MMETSP1089-20130417/2413_1 /TAXON_ID=38269 ORGANISM="Gloeochaete wittrockiana, Strain SAG46.84" /NCGR_SAMPLE_ID=MMETSP1089 /ASSEMBLY_ACC=CAM_ASM_000445 /LENGTH=258 /DNA_ID=CAMNT_0026657231 /DNA_START=68 /DNA_END=844 /DNA_ORIENTATION=+